jgi:hypothetical protein
MSVADITASLQKYEEIIREAVGNGSILNVMSMHRKQIVCVHLLFLSSFLTLHILVTSIQAFQDQGSADQSSIRQIQPYYKVYS